MAKLTYKQRKRRSYKRNLRARVRALHQAIYDQFPDCFAKPGDIRLPLAVGITEHIAGALPDVPRGLLKSAINGYAADLALYRASFRLGEARIGLDGAVAGVVTERDAAHAGALLMQAGLIDLALGIARSIRRAAA